MNKRNPREIVEAFNELMFQIPFEPEEVDCLLREAGFDPQQVSNRMLAAVNKAIEHQERIIR